MDHSIRNEADFQRIYRNGRRFLSENTVVYCYFLLTDSYQYSVVIPNSVISLAVGRNLVRRRIRSIVLASNNLLRGMMFIISVKKDITKLPMFFLREELSIVFGRINDRRRFL